ncbi:MAG: SIS domain-containing protein [Betaproteobacteria bacterium]|nr:SIS domain-containing protein [Betaproteobacteria bacterium]
MQPHISSPFPAFAAGYLERLHQACSLIPIEAVEQLANAMYDTWKDQRQVFIVGNGGSAGNAIHLTNDFIYGISKRMGSGIRMHALPANQAMVTCLGNDLGYENIFSHQLAVLGQSGDLLIALSGSGNSPNILNALSQARAQGLTSFAILGFDGGKAKAACDHAIHVPVQDMQLAEDSQLIVGHMIMQWLYAHREDQH